MAPQFGQNSGGNRKTLKCHPYFKRYKCKLQKKEKEKYVKFWFSVERHEAEMYYYILIFTSFSPLSNFVNKIQIKIYRIQTASTRSYNYDGISILTRTCKTALTAPAHRVPPTGSSPQTVFLMQ